MFDGFVVGIVDLDHLGVAFNRGLGPLTVMFRWVLSQIAYWMGTYLAGKDDNLLHGSGSLVFQELLNDVDTESTGSDDGEVCVPRHELTPVFAVCNSWGYR